MSSSAQVQFHPSRWFQLRHLSSACPHFSSRPMQQCEVVNTARNKGFQTISKYSQQSWIENHFGFHEHCFCLRLGITLFEEKTAELTDVSVTLESVEHCHIFSGIKCDHFYNSAHFFFFNCSPPIGRLEMEPLKFTSTLNVHLKPQGSHLKILHFQRIFLLGGEGRSVKLKTCSSIKK